MKPLKFYLHSLFNQEDSLPPVVTKGINQSYEYLDERIRQGGRLFFVRFGDGEFVTIMGKDHRNYVFNEDLKRELIESFRVNHKDYLIACPINYPYDEYIAKGVYTRFTWEDEMINIFEEQDFDKNIVYENPCIFQCLVVFKPIKLKKFLAESIRNKSKLFIGSTSKVMAEQMYGKIDHYVKIPSKNAYETIDDWWPQIEKNYGKVDMIIPSAGSTSNVVSIRLWNLGYQGKVIDFGSMIDALEQKKTRKWIKLKGHNAFKLLDKKPNFSITDQLMFIKKDIVFFFRNQFI